MQNSHACCGAPNDPRPNQCPRRPRPTPKIHQQMVQRALLVVALAVLAVTAAASTGNDPAPLDAAVDGAGAVMPAVADNSTAIKLSAGSAALEPAPAEAAAASTATNSAGADAATDAPAAAAALAVAAGERQQAGA